MTKEEFRDVITAIFTVIGIGAAIGLVWVLTDWQVEAVIFAGIMGFLLAEGAACIAGTLFLAWRKHLQAERRREKERRHKQRIRRWKKRLQQQGYPVDEYLPGTTLFEYDPTVARIAGTKEVRRCG